MNTPTPIAPVIYPESVVTVTPSPVVLGTATRITPTPKPQITPTPTTAPILQRTLPKLMNLLNYGNNTDFYQQTGFTPRETKIILFIAILLLVTGIYFFYYEKWEMFIGWIHRKMSSFGENNPLQQIVFPFNK